MQSATSGPSGGNDSLCQLPPNKRLQLPALHLKGA
jgi:hypothetical protein